MSREWGVGSGDELRLGQRRMWAMVWRTSVRWGDAGYGVRGVNERGRTGPGGLAHGNRRTTLLPDFQSALWWMLHDQLGQRRWTEGHSPKRQAAAAGEDQKIRRSDDARCGDVEMCRRGYGAVHITTALRGYVQLPPPSKVAGEVLGTGFSCTAFSSRKKSMALRSTRCTSVK